MRWADLQGVCKVSEVYAPPLRAVERVPVGEWRIVYAANVLVIFSPVFVIDGVLRLDGVVRVDRV